MLKPIWLILFKLEFAIYIKNTERQNVVKKLAASDNGQLEEWFDRIKQLIPNMPWKIEPRNLKLRAGIVKRILSEFLTDDERAEYFGLPQGCRMREGAKIISPENLTIGEHCWIGENAILDASGGLEIGSHTSIGLSVFVWSHSSHLTNLTYCNEPGSSLIQRKMTKIGSGCFIAGPSVILPGVTVGNRTLIRPFSTVEKDVPDDSIVDPTGIKEGVLTDKRIARMISRHLAINDNANG